MATEARAPSPALKSLLRPLLVLPGIVAGMFALSMLSFAYTAVLGDGAAGQLAVPAVAITVAVAAIGARWRASRWFGAGLVAGAGVTAVSLFAIYAAFPSQESITDEAGARLADQHLAQLERTPEFLAAPVGSTFTESARRSGCSDWFDRREPVTWRHYDRGAIPETDIVAFYARTWEAAGYQRIPNSGGDRSTYHVWHRAFDGWTASLSVFIDGQMVEVAGRDLDSHACS